MPVAAKRRTVRFLRCPVCPTSATVQSLRKSFQFVKLCGAGNLRLTGAHVKVERAGEQPGSPTRERGERQSGLK